MRHSLLNKILPTLLFALSFCFTLQTPAMACNLGDLGYILYSFMLVLPIVGISLVLIVSEIINKVFHS